MSLDWGGPSGGVASGGTGVPSGGVPLDGISPARSTYGGADLGRAGPGGGDPGGGDPGSMPPWQIFLSHTSELGRIPAPLSFVAAARRAISRLGHVTVDMAEFEPEDSDPAEMCRRRVGECSVYLGIIGFRYGSPVRGRPEVSYTELEFDTATELRRERLVFLLDENRATGTRALLTDEEFGPRQLAFRARIHQSGLTVTQVASPEELETAVMHALVALRYRRERERRQAANPPAAGPGSVRTAPAAGSPAAATGAEADGAGSGQALGPDSPTSWLRRPDEPVVDRPGLMGQLVRELTGSDDRPVAVHGGGGFGKTTLAMMVWDRPEVRARFPDGILWADVGPEFVDARLADRINGLATRLGAVGPGPADPMQAGMRFGELLGARRMLLVVDDVWLPDQLRPFLEGGTRCRRLVTTRDIGVLPLHATAVTVDVMEPGQAQRLLTEAVPELGEELAIQLAARCGWWPVLLRLAAGHLRTLIGYGESPGTSVAEFTQGLEEGGLVAFDDPGGRARAVAATVEASLRLLRDADAPGGAFDRYLELAVFPQGAKIPRTLLNVLWSRTAGWSALQTARFCARLSERSLVQATSGDGWELRLHDVMHQYIREQLGDRLPHAHARLVEVLAEGLPVEEGRPAWWRLAPTDVYLWENLAVHLHEAGDLAGLVALTQDLRWVAAKIENVGPVSVEADMALLPADPAAQALGRLVRQTANLRRPGDPPGAAVATLAAYAAGVEVLADCADTAFRRLPQAALRPAVPPLPDQPDPALIRTMTGPVGYATALAVAADGSWLAAGGGGDALGGGDGTVRIWHPTTGAERVLLAGHTGGVSALIAAPDGSWLASAGRDGTVRIWDAQTGRSRFVLTGHSARVSVLVVAPDGSWLASGSGDGTVRLWDPGTGAERATLTGHTNWISALAVAPDGSWLASGAGDGTVRLWDPDGGACLMQLTGHPAWVSSLGAGPDGTWLASGGGDGAVRLWNLSTGAQRAALTGHVGPVAALVVAPDGRWLASGGGDGMVRLWSPSAGAQVAVLAEHGGPVAALVVAPDGSWLASAASDGTVQVADPAAGNGRAVVTGHTLNANALAVAPDGSWLASAGGDGTVRIWDPAAVGADRARPVGRIRGVFALDSPRSASWLAAGVGDGTVRVWDPGAGVESWALIGHASRVSVLVAAPDGRWLASADEDGVARVWDQRAAIAATDPGAAASPRHPGTSPSSSAGAEAATPALGGTGTGTVLVSRGRDAPVAALVAAPDGSWLASGGADASVRIWDPTTGAERGELLGHERGVLALAVPSTGAWLASAGMDAMVRVWDAPVLDPSSVPDSSVADSSVSDPSGADPSGADPTRRPAADGCAARFVLAGHSSRVLSLVAAPDGSWLASAGLDGTVRIWDPKAGTERHVLGGDLDEVAALTVAPDGSWLASHGADELVWIWDPTTGAQRHVLTGHRGGVLALAVSPDGSLIATAGGDRTVRIWTSAGDPVTMLRLDGSLHSTRWTGPSRLAVGGSRGLYLFDLR